MNLLKQKRKVELVFHLTNLLLDVDQNIAGKRKSEVAATLNTGGVIATNNSAGSEGSANLGYIP